MHCTQLWVSTQWTHPNNKNSCVWFEVRVAAQCLTSTPNLTNSCHVHFVMWDLEVVNLIFFSFNFSFFFFKNNQSPNHTKPPLKRVKTPQQIVRFFLLPYGGFNMICSVHIWFLWVTIWMTHSQWSVQMPSVFKLCFEQFWSKTTRCTAARNIIGIFHIFFVF